MADERTFQITPLGAAIVEAMPRGDKVRRIKRAFKQRGTCPTSAIFDAAQVEAFYRELGQVVKAVCGYVK